MLAERSVPGQHLRGYLPFLASLILALAGSGLVACVPGPAPIIGQNCGTVQQGLGGTFAVGDPSGPETCLWQAYMHCKTATLVFTQFGVDTGDTHTITVERQGGTCAVFDAEQGYSANFGGSRSGITTHTCSGLQQRDGGLIVTGCGAEGDINIPPAPSTPTPTVPPTGTPSG